MKDDSAVHEEIGMQQSFFKLKDITCIIIVYCTKRLEFGTEQISASIDTATFE